MYDRGEFLCKIFMDIRTKEMDFFRPLSRAFFCIQTLDKCINILSLEFA